MTTPTDEITVKCHTQRTVSLLRYIRKLRLGELDDNGNPIPGSIPSESAVHSALVKAIEGTSDEIFGFVSSYKSLLERLLSEREQVLLQNNQDLPEIVFPERTYILCSKKFPVEGMARPEAVELIEQFDLLIQLLEKCRLAGAIKMGNYHSLVRRLDGSERNAFRRLRANVNSSLCNP